MFSRTVRVECSSVFHEGDGYSSSDSFTSDQEPITRQRSVWVTWILCVHHYFQAECWSFFFQVSVRHVPRRLEGSGAAPTSTSPTPISFSLLVPWYEPHLCRHVHPRTAAIFCNSLPAGRPPTAAAHTGVTAPSHTYSHVKPCQLFRSISADIGTPCWASPGGRWCSSSSRRSSCAQHHLSSADPSAAQLCRL